MEKYIKIYFWQAISIAFNFAAVFVVTPYISSNQSLYGIYSIIIAAYLFLSYADFGFLSAGMKYASESFARKDLKSEVQVLGFSGMVFLAFVGIYALIMLGISFYPQLMIKSLHDPHELKVAHQLLVILALFCPALVLQRILQIIYGIRLQDYKFQRVLIVSNLVKVLSAFIFFAGGKYLIVEYFLFSQICTVVAVAVGLYLAKRHLQYDFRELFRSFRFSNALYTKTKKLAFTSIFLTICWILYYEIDPFVIGRLLGSKHVAIYAIGLTLITYFRTVFGILFTPFIARFNHFIGLNDTDGLRIFLQKVLAIFLPFTVFPVIVVVLTTKNFILNWVGSDYLSSVSIAQILVLSYIYSFISYPAGILLMAHERVKALYFTSALQPFIYWIGIACTFSIWALQSFAYFKFLAFSLEAIVYLVLLLRFLRMGTLTFFTRIIMPAIIPLALIVAATLLIRGYLPLDHNKIYLVLYFLVNGTVILAGIICYYFTSRNFKEFANQLYDNLLNKIKRSALNKSEQL